MDFEELRPQQKSFDALAAYLNGSTVNVTVDGRPQRYTGAYVTEDFLRILGVSPMMGRDFTTADNTPGAGKVAIIGYGIWQRDFGGAADIVGKGVRINGKPATIIGVMPQGLRVPGQRGDLEPALQRVPAAAAERSGREQSRGARRCCKDGVSLDQANAEATTLARSGSPPPTRRRNKQFNTGPGAAAARHLHAAAAARHAVDDAGFCVGVLLISCVNVMNMQFARATLRAKELAVRSSLGASRLRLVAADADREPARRRHRRRGRHRARLRLDRLAVGDRAEPREPAAVLHHVRRRRAGAGVHRVLRRWRRRWSPACCRR